MPRKRSRNDSGIGQLIGLALPDADSSSVGGSDIGEADDGTQTAGQGGMPSQGNGQGISIPGKPGLLKSWLVPGLAQGYQAGQFGLAGQQMQGQSALATQALRNSGALDLTSAQGTQERLTQNNAQLAAWATKNGLDMSNPDDLAAAHQALFQPALNNAQQSLSNQGALLNLQGNAINNPGAQANANAGFNATQFSPVADNFAKTRITLNPNETASAMGSIGVGENAYGAVPQGTESTEQRIIQPNGSMMNKTTNHGIFQPGSFSTTGMDMSGMNSMGIPFRQPVAQIDDSTPAPGQTDVGAFGSLDNKVQMQQGSSQGAPATSQQSLPTPSGQIGGLVQSLMQALGIMQPTSQSNPNVSRYAGY